MATSIPAPALSCNSEPRARGLNEGKLLSVRHPAQSRIAVREPPEARDHITVPASEFCGACIGELLEQRQRRLLHRLASEPEITDYGFCLPEGIDNGWAGGLTDEGIDQIARAGRWLQGIETVRTPPRLRSYSAKHCAERWAGDYIGEGALIVAAMALGVPLRRYEEGWGAYLGISRPAVIKREGEPVLPINVASDKSRHH